ncbi:MAG: hypothetical protein ACRD1T_00330 [Acidimicrobiia bacterium]
MRSQEHAERIADLAERSEQPSAIRIPTRSVGHEISPLPDRCPDPWGDIERATRNNAFPQEVIVNE